MLDGLVSLISLSTDQHPELSMNRVLPPQIQSYPVIRFQLMAIIAVDTPLHLKREFFSENSQRNPLGMPTREIREVGFLPFPETMLTSVSQAPMNVSIIGVE
jgi:hypothetical protein